MQELAADTPEERKAHSIRFFDRAKDILAMTIAVLGVTVGFYFGQQKIEQRDQTSLEARIEQLTRSLNIASSTISAIELEIEQRRKLVDDLKRDAQTAEALREASRQQVEAIAQVLRGEIARGKSGFDWWDFAKNLLFTFLGFAMGEAAGWWRRRRHTGGTHPSGVDH
jgi:hypothetical protein